MRQHCRAVEYRVELLRGKQRLQSGHIANISAHGVQIRMAIGVGLQIDAGAPGVKFQQPAFEHASEKPCSAGNKDREFFARGRHRRLSGHRRCPGILNQGPATLGLGGCTSAV